MTQILHPTRTGRRRSAAERASRAQGPYYLLGGVWPLVHFRSFAAVAGPKPDVFQTQIAGALFGSIGATLLLAPRTQPWVRALAATSGLACALVDLRHVRRLRRVFLLDAALNGAFAVAALRGGSGWSAGVDSIATEDDS